MAHLIGARYREQREELRISVSRMAALMGLSQQQVSKMELGQRGWEPQRRRDYERILERARSGDQLDAPEEPA